MKSIRLILLGIFLSFFGNSARSQTDYQNLSLGASLGKGCGIDLSYGKRTSDTQGHDIGWDLAFSIWTPAYRFPFITENDPTTTDNNFLDGAYLEETKENTLGFGLGARYVFKPFAIGGMFDLVQFNHVEYYRDPADNSRSQIREDATLGGLTGTISVNLIENVSLNGFYGTRRGINVGLAWNIINP